MYTLFISYKSGGHYCGVYPTLEYTHKVILEMAHEMEFIESTHIPSVEEITKALEQKDEFYFAFDDGVVDRTWIHVQEQPEFEKHLKGECFPLCETCECNGECPAANGELHSRASKFVDFTPDAEDYFEGDMPETTEFVYTCPKYRAISAS